MKRLCSKEGCDKPYYAKDYCKRHYSYLLRYGYVPKDKPPYPTHCIVEGCGRPFAAKGYCKKHYEKAKYAARKPEGIRVRGVCKLEECDKKHYAKGYCKYHYEKILRSFR